MDEWLEVQANQGLEPAGMHNCFWESAISPIPTSPTSDLRPLAMGEGSGEEAWLNKMKGQPLIGLFKAGWQSYTIEIKKTGECV